MDLAIMDLGGGVGIFGTLLIGAVAGWIAEKLTRGNHGLLTNIIMGILGSFVGFKIADLLDIQLGEIFEGWFWGNVLVSVVGAVLLITIYRMLRGRRA
jgi:uncharacterized membrane protein YeaQ/YmgE (transglycosylase-associated protein family)